MLMEALVLYGVSEKDYNTYLFHKDSLNEKK